MNGVIVLIILIAGLAVGALVGSMLTTKRLTKQPTAAPTKPTAPPSELTVPPSTATAEATGQAAPPADLLFASPTVAAPAPLLAPAPIAEAPRVIPPPPAPAAKFPAPLPAPILERPAPAAVPTPAAAPTAPTPAFATASAGAAAQTPTAFAEYPQAAPNVAPSTSTPSAAVAAAAVPMSWADPPALPDPALPDPALADPALSHVALSPVAPLSDPAANHPSHNPSFLAPSAVDDAALEAVEPTGRVLWAPPPADLAAEVAKVPRRRREDFLPEADKAEEAPLPQAELPPGFTDPITGLPLAEAMRADIELRATDFKTFTVVVCHPMMAMTTPGGMVNASPNAPFGQDELRVFAGVLRDTLRQKDIVGRYDERLFLLFLPRCKVEEVRIVMDRIRANLLLAQVDQPQWVDITFGAAAGQIGESVDGPLKVAYADLLQRNTGPAWFLQA